MKPCSNPLCTNQVDDDDRFCGKCGTYVGPDITQVGKQCVNCGEALLPGQTFCANCGSFTTFVKPQPTVSIDSQANIPTQSVTRIMPPLKVATITQEELEVVKRTSKNVYAPYMRSLIDFRIPNFSEDFAGRRHIGILMRELEVTDFTIQANLTFFSGHTNRLGGDAGFVFRFNTQTGEGYQFFLGKNPGAYREALLVEMFHTRSKLTGEPLQEPNVSRRLISHSYPSDGHDHLIALVAQKATLDIYADLVHLERAENATMLQGKLGFYLPDEDIKLTGSKWFENNRRIKAMGTHFNHIKVWKP